MAATASAVVGIPLPDVRVLRSDAEALAAAADYADSIRPGAVARDRDGLAPHAELRELARTGLLGMRIPHEHGGAGVSSATVAEVFRRIAVADPSIAQIPQNHVQFVDTLIRFGSVRQRELFLPLVLGGARFGNALSERGGRTARDWTTRLTRVGGRYRLNGTKYYSTGALTAQWIPVFAFDDEDRVVMAYVPRDAPGVEVDQDWDAFGQRATVSGTTRLRDVDVDELWIVRDAFAPDPPTTYGAFGQLMHVAIDAGIARAALEDGAAFLRARARPWRGAPAPGRAADDEHLLRLAGELAIEVRAAEALLARAGEALDEADAAGEPRLVDEGRLAVAAAKSFAAKAALRVATEIFDLSGAAAADRAHGLDRHWRNARTHTLHDPARIKQIYLGRHLVDGVGPPASDPLA